VLIVTLAVIAGLILVNALYVAAEFAAVSVRRSRIQELARTGSAAARLLVPTLQDPASLDRYVAACQIGITLSSLVLGAYAQARLAGRLALVFEGWGNLQPLLAESIAFTVVLVALTALQVVFGELVPKSLALQYSTRMALLTAIPMRWSLTAFHWFIAVLNGSAIAMLRWLGMRPEDAHHHVHSPEELELLISESRDGGLLEREEQRRLRQALRLSLRTARQLMVPRPSVVGLDIRWKPERLLEAVLASPYTRLPVYDGSVDRVIGLIHTAAIAAHYTERGQLEPLTPLVKPILTVSESMRADDLLAFLREKRVPQAVVVDEFGGMAGLVTLQDVVAELLGDVGDEFRAPLREVEQLADGRVRVPGRLALADAPDWLTTRWRSHAHTIGGHVVNALGRLPDVGEHLTIDGVPVEVQSVEAHVPGWLVLTPVGEEDDRG
jgi:putative hemolysin